MRASARVDLGQLVALAVEHGQLVVALEAGRAHVGLVLAGAVTGVAHQPGELVLLLGELVALPVALLVELARGPP